MSSLYEPTTTTISVDEAVERTTNWRQFLIDTKQVTDLTKVPKAVYISRADIQALAASLEADETLSGVRAYFTLNSQEAEEIKNNIKFCMVLVQDDGSRAGKDVIYLPSDKLGGEDDSNIYDFTKPCPEYCDIDSPLYGDGFGRRKK